jgi:hypothetical protein
LPNGVIAGGMEAEGLAAMTQQIAVNFPVPPDVAIPEPLQTIFVWATACAAAVLIVVAIVMCRRYRSGVPLLLAAAGFAAILLEPIVTFLGHAVHPAPGQIMLFETVTRAIPWHIALGYTAGFGAYYLIFYAKVMSRTVSPAFMWKTTFITALCYFLGEAYPVSHGLWIYYADQPLRIWNATAPLTWNILNACCMLTSATLIFVALPHLKKLAKLLIVPLAPAGAFMGHMGAGFPMYNVMNSGAPHWAIQLSGVASVAMALVIVWICTLVLIPATAVKARTA